MKTIKLHGWLGKKFGTVFKMDVDTPAEALRALSSQLQGFKQVFIDDTTGFKIFTNDWNLGAEQLQHPFSNAEVLHVVPVIEGESKSPIVTILLGVVLLTAMFFTGGAAAAFLEGAIGETLSGLVMQGLFSFGVSLIVGGVASLLFSPPKPTTSEKPENRPNYNFNGAVNTVQQGGCVPVLYGELVIGSQVVSAGLFVEDIKV